MLYVGVPAKVKCSILSTYQTLFQQLFFSQIVKKIKIYFQLIILTTTLSIINIEYRENYFYLWDTARLITLRPPSSDNRIIRKHFDIKGRYEF